MELEQLKDMWKEQEPARPRDVQPLLNKKSNSPIAKMKKHLVMELTAVIAMYGFVIIYFFAAYKGRFSSVSILYLLVGVVFCIYYFKKFKLLKEMECMACQVKTNLSKQLNTLEKYIRFYLIAGTALIPLVLIFFYWFGYTYIPRGREFFFPQPSETTTVLQSIAIFTLITAVATILSYYLNKWYIRKLYGKYIDKLKEMLSQMEDDAVYS
jgi:magnesium-transporting ATPase (P-type)